MKNLNFLILASALAASPSLFAQLAKSPPADFQTILWASSCMACHGTDGRAEGTGMTIGGRNYEELYMHLTAYKEGQKIGTIMHQHAKGYSDDQLKRIAQYFSQLK